MPDSFPRLRAVVEEALGLPPEERAAFLEAACDCDARLLAEARELLAASVEDTFLEPAPALRTLPDREARIQGFRILRVLGRGGMGVVYEAAQDVPRRRVALKVLADRRSGEASLDRFRYEVEILGTLDHPGIAKVHDAGLADQAGRTAPWFAMELIEDARPITEHADTEALDVRGRLRLYLDVLDAVEHGHQRGVIHRDLKPDNVLVDKTGRPKVIDFGVARVADPELLEATLRTQTKEMVGTLPYMSPEQASSEDVDTRSDVYALGVLLFRLLTGTLPIAIEREDFVTSIRRVVEQPPERLRALAPELPRDLDAVVGKALEKDPARRYRSAGAFADDLRRHLAGEPVEARTPSPADQLLSFARRNKTLAVAALVVLMTLLVSAIVSIGFALDSQDAEREAEAERRRFERLYQTQFLQSVDLIANDAEAVAVLNGGGPLAQQMIESAVARLETLAGEGDGAPGFQLQLAEAYVRLAGSLGVLGRVDEDTEAARRDAIARADAIVGAVLDDDPENAAALRQQIAVLGARGALDLSLGRFDDAKASIDDALHAAKALGLDENDDLLVRLHHVAALVAYRRTSLDEALAHVSTSLAVTKTGDADDADAKGRLADDYRLRAEIQRSRGSFDEARADLERCMALRRALVKDHPERLPYRLEEAQTALALGLIHMALGDGRAAATWYDEAYDLLSALHAEAPTHLGISVEYARALQGLGQASTSDAVGNHAKDSPERAAGVERALRYFEQALEIAEDAVARRPDSNNAVGLVRQLEQQVGMVRRIVDR